MAKILVYYTALFRRSAEIELDADDFAPLLESDSDEIDEESLIEAVKERWAWIGTEDWQQCDEGRKLVEGSVTASVSRDGGETWDYVAVENDY